VRQFVAVPESNGWIVMIPDESDRQFKAYAIRKGSVNVVEAQTRTTSTSP